MNYVYQITNLINNKIYIGVHKNKLNTTDDGYMGSGKIIKSAIEKYGIENFRKDILGIFNTYEEALIKESVIVTDEFLLREDVYNLRRGGTGGFDFINKNGLNFKGFEDKASYNRSVSPMLHPEKYDSKIIEKIKNSQQIARSRMMENGIGIFSPTLIRNFSGLLLPKTNSHKENISKAKKNTGCGGKNSNAKAVADDRGNIFDTVKACAIINGVSENTVRARIIKNIYVWKN